MKLANCCFFLFFPQRNNLIKKKSIYKRIMLILEVIAFFFIDYQDLKITTSNDYFHNRNTNCLFPHAFFFIIFCRCRSSRRAVFWLPFSRSVFQHIFRQQHCGRPDLPDDPVHHSAGTQSQHSYPSRYIRIYWH